MRVHQEPIKVYGTLMVQNCDGYSTFFIGGWVVQVPDKSIERDPEGFHLRPDTTVCGRLRSRCHQTGADTRIEVPTNILVQLGLND